LDAWISHDELIWQILCLKLRLEEKAVKSKPPSQK
jgi:hypothetical protein